MGKVQTCFTLGLGAASYPDNSTGRLIGCAMACEIGKTGVDLLPGVGGPHGVVRDLLPNVGGYCAGSW